MAGPLEFDPSSCWINLLVREWPFNTVREGKDWLETFGLCCGKRPQGPPLTSIKKIPSYPVMVANNKYLTSSLRFEHHKNIPQLSMFTNKIA